MADSILETLGELVYSLGDGNLTIRRNECSECHVNLHWADGCRSDYKPELMDAVLDGVRRAALADQEISFSQYDEHEACKLKLQETQERLDSALKQLEVR